MATCNPSTLLSEGMLCACSPNAQRVAIISLAVNWLTTLDPTAVVTPEALLDRASANKFTAAMSPPQMRAVIIQLLCGIRAEEELIAASLVLTGSPDSETIDWTWNQDDPTSWIIEQSTDEESGFFQVDTAAGSERSWPDPTFFKFYRVVVVGGPFDGTISNVISIPT